MNTIRLILLITSLLAFYNPNTKAQCIEPDSDLSIAVFENCIPSDQCGYTTDVFEIYVGGGSGEYTFFTNTGIPIYDGMPIGPSYSSGTFTKIIVFDSNGASAEWDWNILDTQWCNEAGPTVPENIYSGISCENETPIFYFEADNYVIDYYYFLGEYTVEDQDGNYYLSGDTLANGRYNFTFNSLIYDDCIFATEKLVAACEKSGEGDCEDLSIVAFEACSSADECGECYKILSVTVNGGSGEYTLVTNTGEEVYDGMSTSGLSLESGVSTITVNDTNGCSVESLPFVLTYPCCENIPYHEDLISVDCEYGQATLNVNKIYTSQIYEGALTIQDQDGITYEDGDTLINGAYTFTANFSNLPDCESNTYNITVSCEISSECADLSINAYKDCSPINCGFCYGLLALEASGGSGEYTFSTADGQEVYQGIPLHTLYPSTYPYGDDNIIIVVTDTNGCTAFTNITGECCENPPPLYSLSLNISHDCDDGSIIHITEEYSNSFNSNNNSNYILQDQDGNSYIDGDIIPNGEYCFIASFEDFPDCVFFTEELSVDCPFTAIPDYIDICGTETIEIYPLQNDLVAENAILCSFSVPSYGGTLEFNFDNGLLFTAESNYNGILNVTYTICDGTEFTSGELTLNIMTSETPPTSNEYYFNTDGTPIFIPNQLAIFNVNDPYCEFNNPVTGSIVSTSGGFIYIPDANSEGIVEFSYSTCEYLSCGIIEHTATIMIDVSSSPLGLAPCQDLELELCTGIMTPIILCPEYCDLNDDYEVIEVESLYSCTNVFLGDGCIRYTPLPAFIGLEHIIIKACDEDGNCQDAHYYIHTGDCEDNGSGFTNNESNNTFKQNNKLPLNNSKLKAYPNPNNGIFQLNFNTINHPEALLEIFDYRGKRILQNSIQQGSIEQTINLSNYPKGVYLISLSDGTSKTTQKVLIN